MAKVSASKFLTLNIIPGTHVVILAWSMSETQCKGCMGFAIHRTDHTENEAYWMQGMKTFEETDPGFVAGSTYPTNKHPIQGFTWSDFSAKPDHEYTYLVQALKGTPKDLTVFKEASGKVRTESEADGNHNVYFNRGAAASQEYIRRFGKTRPNENDANDPRWAWLSRGAMEAVAGFVARAKGSDFGLRVCAYEFRLQEFARLLKEAKDRKVDVKIIYDGNNNEPDAKGVVFPRDANREAANKAGIKAICKERITRDDVKDPPIAHNKFVVLLKGKKPIAVLTGSTNFSLGGVFGQANVVHIVDDKGVASEYLQTWEVLNGKLDHGDLRVANSIRVNPAAMPKKKATVSVFSPQKTLAVLERYAELAQNAPNALFMTFPFGMNSLFKEAYRKGVTELRYALLDKLIPSGTRKEKQAAAIAEMITLRSSKNNRFAVGSMIAVNMFDRWVKEVLTGLNQHVQYIHTKFMLIDPLGDAPVVITGSANFSEASTTSNDENMLVIHGDKRVARIYLGEYMRLWNHYAFREWATREAEKKKKGESIEDTKFKFLDLKDQWWRSYFGNTDRARQRKYFARVN